MFDLIRPSTLSIILILAIGLAAFQSQGNRQAAARSAAPEPGSEAAAESRSKRGLERIARQQDRTLDQAKRLALVIGNGGYDRSPLRNPPNDARAVAARLEALGFELIGGGPLLDASQRRMRESVEGFRRRLIAERAIGVFYYAGHGVQINGINYLVPVGAEIRSRADLEFGALNANWLVAKLDEAANPMNLVVLDACRDNPYRAYRGGERGLASVNTRGSLIAFATAPGEVADDGSGDHSPYTRALLDQIDTPGISVLELFNRINRQVKERSGDQQSPWVNFSYAPPFYFHGDPGQAQREREARAQQRLAELAARHQQAEQDHQRIAAESAAEARRKQVLEEQNQRLKQARQRENEALDQTLARLAELGRQIDQAQRQAERAGQAAKDAKDAEQAKRQREIAEREAQRAAELAEQAGIEQRQAAQRAEELRRLAATSPETTPVGNGQISEIPANGIEPALVELPGGCFQMGSPAGEAGRDGDERQHRVCVEPFAIGKYEVTFAEYDRFAAATGRERPKDRGWGRGNRPVIYVSWEDASAYADWLSRETGKGYRLPSEAEWEYAARAGTETPFSFGRRISTDQANFDGNYPYANGPKGRYRKQTVPVGSLPANPWGLHEIHGNVWEWTCSAYRRNSYDGSEQRCQTSGGAPRAIRGGSWDSVARLLRSAVRFHYSPGSRVLFLGFRLARTR